MRVFEFRCCVKVEWKEFIWIDGLYASMHISCETMRRTSNANTDATWCSEYVPISGKHKSRKMSLPSFSAWCVQNHKSIDNLFGTPQNCKCAIIKHAHDVNSFCCAPFNHHYSGFVICLHGLFPHVSEWCSHIDKPKWLKSIQTKSTYFNDIDTRKVIYLNLNSFLTVLSLVHAFTDEK